MVLFRACSLIKSTTEKFIQPILHAVHSMPHCQHSALSFSLSIPHSLCVCIHYFISWNSEHFDTKLHISSVYKAIKNRCDMVVFRISFRVVANTRHAHSHQIFSVSVTHHYSPTSHSFLSLSYSFSMLGGCLAVALACLSI